MEIGYERFGQSGELSPGLYCFRKRRSQGFIGLNCSSSEKFFDLVCQVPADPSNIFQRLS